MKSSFLCVIELNLLYLVVTDAVSELVALRDKSYLNCAYATGVKEDMVLSVIKGDWPEESDILKEWVHCVLVENKVVKVMREQGEVQIYVDLTNLTQSEADKKTEKMYNCLPTHTFNVPAEEISWYFAKCYQKEDAKNSLF